MKRGRPNKRNEIQFYILKILSSINTPLTISTITRLISNELKTRVSWNTVQKYIQELVKLNKVQTITVPHSKIENKDGLTLYILKK
jgi:predicted transcriptional regulator